MAGKAARKLYNGERWRRKGIRRARWGREGVFITQEIRVGLVSATLVLRLQRHLKNLRCYKKYNRVVLTSSRDVY